MNENSEEEVSEFYSSSEDISWGKPSTRELLNYFNREVSTLSSRRQTFPPRSSMNTIASLIPRPPQDPKSEKECRSSKTNSKEVVNSPIALSSDDEESVFEESNSFSKPAGDAKVFSSPITISSEDEGNIEEATQESTESNYSFDVEERPKITGISTLQSNPDIFYNKSHENDDMGSSKYLSLPTTWPVDELSDSFNKHTFISSTSSKTQYFSANEENAPKSIASTNDSFESDRLSTYSYESKDYPSRNENEDDKENIFLNDTFDDMENMLINHLQTVSDDESNNDENKSVCKSERSLSKIPMFVNCSVPKKSVQKDDEGFKLPTRCCKTSKKTPVKRNSPNKFQDTVSPIRMYIKNSSMPFLKQTHKPSTTPTKYFPLEGISEISKINTKKHKGIMESFPEIVYKPSKLILQNSESRIILPENIKKLVKERVVIKHEVRRPIKFHGNEFSTSDELGRNDLSCIVSDDKNMSLHSAKQGFNM